MHDTVERLKWPRDPVQYEKIYQFLLRCADRGYNEHFHWARFEWMMHHSYLDTEHLNDVALFLDEQGIMHGLCTYDTSWGEGAFLVHDSEDEALLNRMVDYAVENGYHDIMPNMKDEALLALLEKRNWRIGWGGTRVLEIDLNKLPDTPVPAGYTLSAPDQEMDLEQYRLVLHKGFENEGELDPWPPWVLNPLPPHDDGALDLFAIKDGEYCAHAGIWYTSGDTCYVEPVATVPEHRRKGLAAACLMEGIRRAGKKGAKRAIVLSSDSFYRNLGFDDSSMYLSWERKPY